MPVLFLLAFTLIATPALAVTPKAGLQAKLANICHRYAQVKAAEMNALNAKYGRNVTPELCQCAGAMMNQKVIRLGTAQMEALDRDRQANQAFLANGMLQSMNACAAQLRR